MRNARRGWLFGEYRREAIEHALEPQVEAVLEAVGIWRRRCATILLLFKLPMRARAPQT